MAMVLLFHEAFHFTKDKSYLAKLYTSFMWFLGDNDLRMSLYDFETKDAVMAWRVMEPTETRSWNYPGIPRAHLTVLKAFEDSYKTEN